MSHYTEDQLSAYALRRDSIPDPQTVTTHLSACDECSAALETIEEFDAALHDPLPWKVADSHSDQRHVPDSLLARARAIAAADAYARELLQPLVHSAPRFSEACIEKDERFHTWSAVRFLCNAASGMHERQPQFSLMLASAAVDIAATLPLSSTSNAGACLGTAWKERANALRFLGRFHEAQNALDRAAEAFHLDRDVEPFDLAIVDYVRATVCGETEQFDEAVPLARQAAEQFLVYGDRRRYLAARLVEGFGYYSVDRDREAVPIFESVITIARAANELSILGAALANAASCHTHLGAFARAAEYYGEALAVLDALDLSIERVRVQWAFAAMKVENADYDQGLPELIAARDELARLELSNDASLASLDLAAGLLAAGHHDGVAALCRSIVVSFASEGLTRNARKALAYLNEAVNSGEVTAEDLREVREYLHRLPSRPLQEFSPRH